MRQSSRQRSAARSEPPQNRRCSTVRNAARSSEKSCLRALARRSITPRQPVSSHTRSKASAGPMRRVAIVVASPRSSASSTIAFSAKRAPERKSRSNCPPWIPERSATRLREADLNVLSELGKQGLEWRLEPEAFSGREVGREDDLLDFLVGCPVDIEVARQPST